MGLITRESAPDGKIVKADVTIAKNYLSEKEMSYLERIVPLYLDYAELQAERRIPMTMEDWAKRLDGFLEFNGNELLMGPGKVSAEQAKLHAETEFEKYRIVQDRSFMSDYDKYLLELERQANQNGALRQLYSFRPGSILPCEHHDHPLTNRLGGNNAAQLPPERKISGQGGGCKNIKTDD